MENWSAFGVSSRGGAEVLRSRQARTCRGRAGICTHLTGEPRTGGLRGSPGQTPKKPISQAPGGTHRSSWVVCRTPDSGNPTSVEPSTGKPASLYRSKWGRACGTIAQGVQVTERRGSGQSTRSKQVRPTALSVKTIHLCYCFVRLWFVPHFPSNKRPLGHGCWGRAWQPPLLSPWERWAPGEPWLGGMSAKWASPWSPWQ